MANAVLDGSDAVMLSGETASGAYPVQAVEMMAAIIGEVEAEHLGDVDVSQQDKAFGKGWDFATAGARAAALLSFTMPLAAIVTLTRDGRTANLLSEYRPKSPIVAVTPSPQAATRLALRWGVMPRLGVPAEDLEETLRVATSVLAREKMCKRGEAFALIVGWPPSSSTNTVKLHRM